MDQEPYPPVAIVERTSLPDARISFTTLECLGALEAPGLIFVGEVYREAAAAAAAGEPALRIPSQSA